MAVVTVLGPKTACDEILTGFWVDHLTVYTNYILVAIHFEFSWCNLHTENFMWYLVLLGIDAAHALTNYIVFPLKYLNGHSFHVFLYLAISFERNVYRCF